MIHSVGTTLLLVLGLWCVVCPAPLRAQWTRPASGAHVYLVTAGPGGEFFTWFGHAALVVTDSRQVSDYWYDYGVIDVDWAEAHARGRLRARVERSPIPKRHLADFVADDRDILVQRLQLSPSQTDELIRLMDEDVRVLGSAGYDYRHTEDNCTTRIRDVIDRAAGGALRRSASTAVATRTIREDGYRRFVVRSRLFTFLADVVTGRRIDQPMSAWDAMFLPEELALHVRRTTLAPDTPLAVEHYRVASIRHVLPSQPAHHHLALAALGSAIGALALGLARYARRGNVIARVTLGVVATTVAMGLGVAGVIMSYAWAMTQYTFTQANENVLFANPLILTLAPLGVAYATGSRRAARWLRTAWVFMSALLVMSLLLKLLPAFNQDNWRVMALLLPLVIGLAWALHIATRKISSSS